MQVSRPAPIACCCAPARVPGVTCLTASKASCRLLHAACHHTCMQHTSVQVTFARLIIDEGQCLGNSSSKLFGALSGIASHSRWLLSGERTAVSAFRHLQARTVASACIAACCLGAWPRGLNRARSCPQPACSPQARPSRPRTLSAPCLSSFGRRPPAAAAAACRPCCGRSPPRCAAAPPRPRRGACWPAASCALCCCGARWRAWLTSFSCQVGCKLLLPLHLLQLRWVPAASASSLRKPTCPSRSMPWPPLQTRSPAL